MQLRAEYEFPDDIADVALEYAEEQLELAYVVAQLPRAWDRLERAGEIEKVVFLRNELLEYAGALYALERASEFREAVSAFLDHSLARSTAYAASPGDLFADLALALAVRDKRVDKIASLVVAARMDSIEPDARALAAVILAHLALGNFTSAESSANRLADACDNKQFNKHTCLYFGQWVHLASAVRRVDVDGYVDASLKADEQHREFVIKQITRMRNGQPPIEGEGLLWDWERTGLESLAARTMRLRRTPVRRFTDLDWIRSAMRGPAT